MASKLGAQIKKLIAGQQCTFADDKDCYDQFPFDGRTRSMHKLGNGRALAYRVNKNQHDKEKVLHAGIKTCDNERGSCPFDRQIPQVLESQMLYDNEGKPIGPLDGRVKAGSPLTGHVLFEKRHPEYPAHYAQGRNVGANRLNTFMRSQQQLARQCESLGTMCGDMNTKLRTSGVTPSPDDDYYHKKGH